MMLVLTGCTLNTYSTNYLPYATALGPNNDNTRFFYHYIPNEEGYIYSTLAQYDIETGNDSCIYTVEDVQKQRIISFAGNDNVVLFVVKTFSSGEDNCILYYKNLITDTINTIVTSEEDISIIVSGDDIKILYENSIHELQEQDNTYSISIDGKTFENDFNSHKNVVRMELENGNVVAISKEYGQENYAYQIGNTKGVINALSEYDCEYSGLSNNFVVDEQNVIGVVSILKEHDGTNGILPSNLIKSGVLDREVLICIDAEDGKSTILYSTPKGIIIGYDNNNVLVYENGKILKSDLETQKEEVIYAFSNNNTGQLSFNWLGNSLVIFDEDNLEVVDSFSVNLS